MRIPTLPAEDSVSAKESMRFDMAAQSCPSMMFFLQVLTTCVIVYKNRRSQQDL